jgi:hypothetical protein
MTTAFAHTFKPTRSRILTAVIVLAILFGCYGLLSAQQARSATTLSKQVWGGIRSNGAVTHQKHIIAVNRVGTGDYLVTFDRHVNNCSIQVTTRYEGSAQAFYMSWSVGPGSSNNQVEVLGKDSTGTVGAYDSDFDIFGMCPSS